MSAAPRRVLLADGAPPAALALARSLVRAGHRVEATDARFGDRAPRSSGVVGFPAPSPARDPAGFAAAVRDRALTGERAAVIPTTDAALLALLPRRTELEGLSDLLLPPAEALRRALDKGETLEAAQSAGVSIPDTFTVRTAADLERPFPDPPLVVKPLASRWRAPGGALRGAGPAFARDPARARTLAEVLLAGGAPGVLVQTFVPGTGRGVGLLVRGGRTAAVFVHRRLREVHPAGGPSSAAVSEAPDPALVAPAEALLRALGFEGLAMVEFRREAEGVPVLMEVNPRPWGTIGLAVDSGVDFPRLLVEGYAGPPPSYGVGVRRRWLAGDLRRVGAAWSGPPRDFPGAFPTFGSALGDALLGWETDFVFRWDDPLPFVAEVAGVLS
jgi:predicted ATP-grasp superfamily ATP-dependent carboligase